MRAEQTAMIEIAKDFIVIKDVGRDGEDRLNFSAVHFSFSIREGRVTRL